MHIHVYRDKQNFLRMSSWTVVGWGLLAGLRFLIPLTLDKHS